MRCVTCSAATFVTSATTLRPDPVAARRGRAAIVWPWASGRTDRVPRAGRHRGGESASERDQLRSCSMPLPISAAMANRIIDPANAATMNLTNSRPDTPPATADQAWIGVGTTAGTNVALMPCSR